MTEQEKILWLQFAAALRDDKRRIAKLEAEIAQRRLAAESLHLRMRCLENGVNYGDILW